MSAKFSASIIKDFDESKLRKLISKFESTKHTVDVGFPAGIEHKDDNGSAGPFTVAQIAAVHEFGSDAAGVPERSFIRSAIGENRLQYVALNRDSMKKMLEGQMTMVEALGRLGALAQGHIQMKIAQGPFVPLKQATIDRKGSSKPLIDSSQMRQSVQWVLSDD